MGDYFAGIDIGSTMTKVVILGEDRQTSLIGPTGPEHRKLANRVMEEALGSAGIAFADVAYVVATGYGRINVPFADRQITEITCHAKGLSHLLPSVRTVIDIGGQDSKGIKIKNGKVASFVMNDKCAAGTGRFLEIIADALGVPLGELGELSASAERPAVISNTCTVFAEQEVISQIAAGEGRTRRCRYRRRCEEHGSCSRTGGETGISCACSAGASHYRCFRSGSSGKRDRRQRGKRRQGSGETEERADGGELLFMKGIPSRWSLTAACPTVSVMVSIDRD
jgi:predicted CoA-substrate-specific enzyme activase